MTSLHTHTHTPTQGEGLVAIGDILAVDTDQ